MILDVISIILLYSALIFMAFGLLGIFRFRHFHARILVTSKVESVGFLTLMAAVILSAGISYFSLKTGLIAVFVLMTNPIATHAIAHSAIQSGYQVNKNDQT